MGSRIKRNAQYVVHKNAKNTPESSVELLNVISRPLRMELDYEVHGPILNWHPFFRFYSEVNFVSMHQVCHTALSRSSLMRGDILFHDGEIPAEPKMYFVLSGELQYRRRGKEVQKVEQKAWISEPVLWVDQWAHHGGFMGKSSCNLLCLNAKTFQFVAMQYRTAMFFPAQYAVAY